MEKRFLSAMKNDLITYEKTQNIKACQGDDYTAGSFLDYNFKDYYEMISIDFSTQQVLNADPKKENKSILLKI